jgi:hypothetical protein
MDHRRYLTTVAKVLIADVPPDPAIFTPLALRDVSHAANAEPLDREAQVLVVESRHRSRAESILVTMDVVPHQVPAGEWLRQGGQQGSSFRWRSRPWHGRFSAGIQRECVIGR